MKKIGDPAIALTVVVCSVILFLALAFALNGNPFNRPARTLRAQLPDVTGIEPSSAVKYGGAPAGTVHSIRMLTPDERRKSADPANTVEVTIALDNDVPPLSEGLIASVSSDTLLSDKFLLLSGGDPSAPELKNGALIAAVPPVTFDALLRDLGTALAKFKQIFGGAGGQFNGILPKVDKLIDDLGGTVAKADSLITGGSGLITNANTLVDNGDGLITNADKFIASGQQLIDTNREPLNRLIQQLSSAADSLDDLAKRTDKLIKDNESDITSSVKDAKAALAELKAVASSTHLLVDSLRARPQQLIWGPGRTPKPQD